ncbi:hypothetical protein, partial [Tessaracoccus sp. OH4464_COT-324]|uniref:hypothetical protein n=1 Tax=Tessaracoccus sp. OH4464_COT-324 TaxID=2491059 RepID=UPI001319EF90
RVSPVWFKKLKRGQTLDQAFMQAFAVSGYSVVGGDGSTSSAEPDEDLEVEPPDIPLEEYAALFRAFSQMRREAVEQVLSEPAPQAGPTVGRFAGVTIWLGSNGHPERIEFDEDWLDDAQVGAICTAVERAARDAFSRYREVADDRLRVVEQLDEGHRLMMAGLRRFL